jgi:hypothetical protein
MINLSTQVMREIARAMIGIPYLDGGRTRAGADCRGIVEIAYRAAGIELPSIEGLEPDNLERHSFASWFHEVEELEDFDIVRFCGGDMKRHLGIFMDGNVLHTHRGTGCLFQPIQRLPVKPPYYRLNSNPHGDAVIQKYNESSALKNPPIVIGLDVGVNP